MAAIGILPNIFGGRAGLESAQLPWAHLYYTERIKL
jgi:hypothetical protein